MESLRFALFAIFPAVVLPVAAEDKSEMTQWKSHESLKTVETADADWRAVKDSKLEITSRGLHLPGNSRMVSRFQIADGGRIKFTYVTNNRNAIVRICGKDLKVKAPDKPGPEVYVVDIIRKGRKLIWGVTILDARGRIVGAPVKAEAILIDEAVAEKPGRVGFGSEPVLGRGDSNSVGDIRFKSIVVTGPVVPSADPKVEIKKK
jgi:hypothetical protein